MDPVLRPRRPNVGGARPATAGAGAQPGPAAARVGRPAARRRGGRRTGALARAAHARRLFAELERARQRTL